MSLPNTHPSLISNDSNDLESPESLSMESFNNKQTISIPSDSLGPNLESVSLLSHLALFGILGVLIRFSSSILFGPDVGKITEDNSIIFIDLPSNMIGCFIMGFVGYVFKKDLISYSEHLAVGLSTGLCGSITTFASWHQRMLALLSSNQWQQAFAGYIVGASLSYMSFIVGADLASALKSILDSRSEKRQDSSPGAAQKSPEDFISSQMKMLTRKWVFLLLFLASSALLWIGAIVGSLLTGECLKIRKMFVGCALAPFGVWIRWYLSRFNFVEIGKSQRLKWFPSGTFAANISAVAMEAVVSIVDVVVSTRTSMYLMGGIQLGFLGCLSTVSTLVVESHNLHQGKKKFRSYIYYLSTIGVSLFLGILIFSVPIWTTNYEARYGSVLVKELVVIKIWLGAPSLFILKFNLLQMSISVGSNSFWDSF